MLKFMGWIWHQLIQLITSLVVVVYFLTNYWQPIVFCVLRSKSMAIQSTGACWVGRTIIRPPGCKSCAGRRPGTGRRTLAELGTAGWPWAEPCGTADAVTWSCWRCPWTNFRLGYHRLDQQRPQLQPR